MRLGVDKVLGVVVLMMLGLVCFFCGDAGCAERGPGEIISDYLKLPHPANNMGKDHRARWDILMELENTPDESVEAIRVALGYVEGAGQRYELVSMLGNHFHTERSAEILCGLLQDGDSRVRLSAVGGLRKMARRIERSGPRRFIVSREGRSWRWVPILDEGDVSRYESEPEVKGLLPYLVKAAEDRSEDVRIGALYALAEMREAEAVDAILKRLEDESGRVGFYAACFLTEYNSSAGLEELIKNLERLRNADPGKDIRHYGDAAMLMASFERITGASLGEIPMNPHVSSSAFSDGPDRFEYLLGAWSLWWGWAGDDAKGVSGVNRWCCGWSDAAKILRLSTGGTLCMRCLYCSY